MSWWDTFYGEELAILLLRNTDKSAEAETIAFLKKELGISSGSVVFDQCCGEGRLSLPMALEGAEVFGVDQSEPYITAASSVGRELGATYVVADAFEYVPPIPCDAAFNWWTSFGYAETDEENARMIERAFDALKSGGKFALDFVNVLNVLHQFKPTVVTEAHTDDGLLTLTRHTRILASEDVMEKDWIYELPDGRRVEHTSRVRTYTPFRLKTFFHHVGFHDVRLYGEISQTELTIESPRCIVVGTKP